MKITTRTIAEGAIIAAVYAVITVLIAPLSYGMMQLRISEALTVLPVFTPVAIPGLFIGCLLANIMSPVGIADVIIGSLATLVAGCLSYKFRANRALALLPPVIANGVFVGLELYYLYGVDVSLPACMLWVAAGEALACYGLGYPLSKVLDRHKNIFK